MQQLGPSHDAQLEEPETAVLPEDELRRWTDFGRGRGALLGACALGLFAFFLPWVELIRPESVVRSGFDLARGRAGWLWGGVSAYLVLLPLVFTRRTIRQLRGVRVVAVLLASLTACEVLMMLLLPPRSRGLLPVALTWRFGIYLSGGVSVIAAAIGARLGGALPALPTASTTPQFRADGQTLH
jgi:hypothetical protein